jgi:hypothetical protein
MHSAGIIWITQGYRRLSTTNPQQWLASNSSAVPIFCHRRCLNCEESRLCSSAPSRVLPEGDRNRQKLSLAPQPYSISQPHPLCGQVTHHVANFAWLNLVLTQLWNDPIWEKQHTCWKAMGDGLLWGTGALIQAELSSRNFRKGTPEQSVCSQRLPFLRSCDDRMHLLD